jgi:hypothetical protein
MQKVQTFQSKISEAFKLLDQQMNLSHSDDPDGSAQEGYLPHLNSHGSRRSCHFLLAGTIMGRLTRCVVKYYNNIFPKIEKSRIKNLKKGGGRNHFYGLWISISSPPKPRI